MITIITLYNLHLKMKRIQAIKFLLEEEEDNVLNELKQFIETEVLSRKRKREDNNALKRATSSLKRHYEKHAPEDAPKFEPMHVFATSRSDGGYEGNYRHGDTDMHVKAYVTFRLGDHDLFTDVWGSVCGKDFYTDD